MPRKTGRSKAAALSSIDTNASSAMTPRRSAEVTALKDENEALKSEMASLTETLAKMEMKENAAATLAKAPTVQASKATALPAVEAPNFSLIKMPPAPAKPISPYRMFCNKMRPSLAGMSVPEQAKKLGAEWGKLTEAEKEPFVAAVASDRVRYDAEMKRYNAEVAKINLEKEALTMMYNAKKTEKAIEFYNQELARASGAPQVPVAPKPIAKMESKPKREAPKKPKTGYQFFSDDKREALAKKTKEGEKLVFAEVMKKVSQDWNKLEKTKSGQKTLKKYADMHEADKARYAQQLEEYKQAEMQDAAAARAEAISQLEADKKEAMKVYAPQVRQAAAAREAEVAAKETKKARKAARAGEPKRARSAYIFFGLGERANVVADMPGSNQAMIMAELGKRWKEADESARAKYVAQAEEDQVRYAKEMAAFKNE